MSRKVAITAIILILVGFGVLALQQILYLRSAHSTFENYYAFRGCASLVSRTADAGVCKLASGQEIKIVQWNGKWYLDGDLPVCRFGFCI